MAWKETEKKYKQKSIKRVPLDMQKTEYERLKAYCERNGMKVNTFIKSLLKPYIQEKPE